MLISFGRKKHQESLRKKLLRNYLIAFISLLSFKEIKAQELPFAEPLIDPFNIYQNGYDDDLDTFSLNYFFVDIDLDGDQDLFFVEEDCPEYYWTPRGYYQKNELNETGNFSNKIPFSNLASVQSIFYSDYFKSGPKLVDIDNDGDLDNLMTRAYHYGYSGDESVFQYLPNLSDSRDSFDFGEYVGVGSICNAWNTQYSGCVHSYNFGDIDGDGDYDVLFCNTHYQSEYGYESTRWVNFRLFERNENSIDSLFKESELNPYNLEAIGNTLNLDSNVILEIFLSDVNMDGQNDISVLSIEIVDDSISGIISYELQLKTFYKLSNSPILFNENEHLIWTHKGQYTYDYEYYESTNTSAKNYLISSFLYYSNINLIDLDNDGDQDIFFREVKNYLSDDYYNCDARFKTRMYYYENQSIVSNIEESEKVKIEVYPNPSNEIIHFKTGSIFSNNAQFELYNINGSLVLKSSFSNQNFDINKGELPSGVYYYKLYDKQILLSGSIIFQ